LWIVIEIEDPVEAGDAGGGLNSLSSFGVAVARAEITGASFVAGSPPAYIQMKGLGTGNSAVC
jgi:hypothetical protein